MKTYEYPLLCYPLDQMNQWVGLLVGTNLEQVGESPAALVQAFEQFLQREYRRNNNYPQLDLQHTRMKTVSVKVYPTHQINDKQYPIGHAVHVPVHAIYGRTQDQLYWCCIPYHSISFNYFNADQLDILLRHRAAVHLQNKSPEYLYSLVTISSPELKLVKLRVNPQREDNWYGEQRSPVRSRLHQIAESLPGSTRRQQLSPQTAWERKPAMESLQQKIITDRRSTLVIGHSGSGKSAVLNYLIKRHHQQQKRNYDAITFWRMRAERLLANARYLGEWQQACVELIDLVNEQNGVLWVEQLSRLAQLGGQTAETSVAAFLLPYIQSGQLQLIGELTPEEIDQLQLILPNFVAAFQQVVLAPLNEHEVRKVMSNYSSYCQQKLKIKISSEAIDLSLRLMDRFEPFRALPGKAISFLEKVVGETVLLERKQVNRQIILDTFSKQSGLPKLFLDDHIPLDRDKVREFFSQRIIGQDAVIEQLLDLISIYKTGLNPPGRPIATMLFNGPTGVGKTATTKALSDYFFGAGQTKSPLIYIDMSEYQHISQVSKLIGTRSSPGQLVSQVRKTPFSVVLLDESDKADPKVFDSLLTLFDEGVIQDANGRPVNFRNAIIIMTANLGASATPPLGYGKQHDLSQTYMSAVKKRFRPEFINRIDHVVHFRGLSAADIEKITRKELSDLHKVDGIQSKGIQLRFSPELIIFLQEKGYDPRYGARPLQRLIDQRVLTKLAYYLNEHAVKDTTLLIDYQEDTVRITQAEAV